MSLYSPLFSVSFKHGYFTDGRWRGLDIEPDLETSRMAGLSSLVIRQVDNCLMVCVDEHDREPLRMWSADRGGKLRFRFKVRAKDKNFSNYTDNLLFGRGVVACFENPEQEKKNVGIVSLSKVDSREINALVAEGVLGTREKLMPPDFIVTIFVDVGKQGFGCREYQIRFETRQSYWKYYLLAEMNRAELFIVDLEKKVEFLSCGEELVAENRPARVFRSKQPVPLLEKSECRFQLKERSESGERVLIKRLPLASEARLGRELINGKNELVMENFVHF